MHVSYTAEVKEAISWSSWRAWEIVVRVVMFVGGANYKVTITCYTQQDPFLINFGYNIMSWVA